MTTANTQLEKCPAAEPEKLDERPVFAPATDVHEKADTVLVRCDMPGVDEKDLEITLEDSVLTVSGRQGESAPEGYECLAGEYATGVYQRTFRVSNEIDGENIRARLRNGVLELELPKTTAATPKRVNITTN